MGQMMAKHPERAKLTNDEFRNMIATVSRIFPFLEKCKFFNRNFLYQGEKHIKQEKRSENDEEYQNNDTKMITQKHI